MKFGVCERTVGVQYKCYSNEQCMFLSRDPKSQNTSFRFDIPRFSATSTGWSKTKHYTFVNKLY